MSDDKKAHGPRIVGNFDPSDRKPGQCWCDWREGVPCLLPYAFVVENVKQPGISQMCAAHTLGLKRIVDPGTVRIWPRAEWEQHARERYEARERAAGLAPELPDAPPS